MAKDAIVYFTYLEAFNKQTKAGWATGSENI